MRRLTRTLAATMAVAAIAAACANPSDAERNVIAAALDEYAAPQGSELERDIEGEIDPFGLETERPTEEDRGIGVVTSDAPRHPIDQFRCPFDQELVTASRCGKIELPGRGNDADYSIKLAFVRFSATGDEAQKQPDPVVFLHGGPGGSILDEADLWYDSIVAPHIETRDVILYDQRGGGRSTTLPVCHELEEVSDRFYEEVIEHDALADDYRSELAACGDRLNSITDLTAFNSAANAQDLVDLMWALGVETYNIHGSSYGTRLAQTVMRDAPGGVRSLILSGVYPIEQNLMGSVTGSLEGSLDAVFTACAATPECNEALPNPWRALESIVDELDRSPLALDLGNGFAAYDLRFDGTDLLNGLHSFVYSGDSALSVPDLLIDFSDGDDRRLRRLAAESVFDHTDIATFLTVQCADEGPFTTAEHLARPLAHEFLRTTDHVPSINGTESLTICDSWNVAASGPIEDEPVTWDVPTLLLSGGLDPITPPEWAAELAARLPRSRLVFQPGASHDADDGPCALRLIESFIEDPDLLLDSSCAVNGELTVPTRADRFQDPVVLDEWSYDINDDGEYFDGTAPDWLPGFYEDVQVFWRDLGPLDPTSVIVLPADSAYDPVSHLVVYELKADWAETGSAVLGWDRSHIKISTGELVRFVNTTTGVQVVLVTETAEPDNLEAEVLVPMVEAIGDNA